MGVLPALKNYVTIPTLRNRVLVTVGVALTYLMAIWVPGPSLVAGVETCTQSLEGVYGALSVVGGGAITRLSPVTLGVAPILVAGIVATLLMRIVPRWKGSVRQPGLRKVFVTLTLSIGGVVLVGNAFNIAAQAQSGTLIPGCEVPMIPQGAMPLVVTAMTMIVGSAVLIALGELVSKYGLGSGLLMIVGLGIMVGVPGELSRVGQLQSVWLAVTAGALLLVLLVGLVKLSAAKVSLPVSLRGSGEREEKWFVPANPAGVTPLVMSSILMFAPSLIVSFVGSDDGWGKWVKDWLSNGSSWLFILLLVVLTVVFTFYQVIVSYDADDLAHTFAKSNVFVTGTSDVEATRKAIDDFLLVTTAKAAGVLAVLAVLPAVAAALLGLDGSVPLGGVSLLLVALAVVTVGRHAAALERSATGCATSDDEKTLANPGVIL